MSIPEAPGSEVLQLVTFTVGREEYGVEILRVQEIIRPVEVTRVPNAPEGVTGVINLRGKVIPLVDLRQRFGLSRTDHGETDRIIVVELREQIVGLVVDSVKEVKRVPSSAIESAPDVTLGTDSHFISGIVRLDEKLIIMLDLERVLSLNGTEDHLPEVQAV